MNHDNVTQIAERQCTKIVYRVYGSAYRDLIIVPGIISPVEYTHKLPGYTDFLDRLSKHFRIVVFDKRGNGLSQKLEESAPTLEQRMDDIRFVMDAVDSKRATTNGVSERGALSALFAAIYPDRATSLILFRAFAHTPGLERLDRYPGFLRKFLKRLMIKR